MTASSGDSGKASIHQLTAAVCSFARERDWEQFHDPKNLAMAIASEAGELAAVLRWSRNDESDRLAQVEPTRERLRREIGDVGILLLLLCARVGIPFETAISVKLEENARNYPVGESIGRAERPDVRV